MLNKIITSISTVSSQLTNHGASQTFKFLIDEKIECPFNPLFELFSGKSKSGILNIPGNVEASILVFKKTTSNTHLVPFAQTAMKKLVSIRHPSVLHVLDSCENDSGIYIATEKVVPLTIFTPKSRDSIYGIYQLAKGIEFIHSEVKIVHGFIDPVNIYVTEKSNEYRIGGFELARNKFDSNYHYDRSKFGSVGFYKELNCRDVSETDLCGFVLVVNYMVNGPSDTGSIGSSLTAIVDSVSNRAKSQDLRLYLNEVSRAKKISSKVNFFTSNESIDILEFLDNIHLHGEQSAGAFLDNLPARLGRIPPEMKQGVLIDKLLNSVLSISSLIPSTIPVIASIASEMDKLAFQKIVEPKFVSLFSIQDRSIRFRLLSSMSGQMCKLIDQKILETQLLVEALSGFTDSHPSIRDETLKAVVVIAEHVTVAGGIEKRIMPNLIRILRDPESGIRTNAIVAITKISKKLEDEVKRNNALSTAIIAGLKDSFNPARIVALEVLKETIKINSISDAKSISEKYLGILGGLVVDDDPEIAHSSIGVLEKCISGIKAVTPPLPLKKTQQTSEPSVMSFTPTIAPVFSKPVNELTPPAFPKPAVASSYAPSAQRADAFDFLNKKKINDSDFDSFWDDVAPPKPRTNPSDNMNNSLI